eukprot:870466-Rhodomonas_salina.1
MESASQKQAGERKGAASQAAAREETRGGERDAWMDAGAWGNGGGQRAQVDTLLRVAKRNPRKRM